MKKLTEKLKKQYGITLIALIVTIIVLLILAGVTIATLTGDNGLLQKATNTKQANENANIEEQIKLAYIECQTEKLYNTNVDENEFLTKSLKEKLNDNDLTVNEKKGKKIIKAIINSERKIFIFKSSDGEAYEYKDPFDYKGKKKKDLVPGDDISIRTENFRVFYNKDGVIKAMPFYNIEIKLDNPMQNVSAESCSFSTEAYWTKGTDVIDMNDNRNCIQQYIDAYEGTLEKFGVEEITVRIARNSEMVENGVTSDMRNPSKRGDFWLGSGVSSYGWYVRNVLRTGNLDRR